MRVPKPTGREHKPGGGRSFQSLTIGYIDAQFERHEQTVEVPGYPCAECNGVHRFGWPCPTFKPRAEGWYWFENDSGSRVVEVWEHADEGLFVDDPHEETHDRIGDLPGAWIGPITPGAALREQIAGKGEN